jgi:hypothetical protein
MTTETIARVPSEDFDKDPERYLAQATPGHILQVVARSGGTTVIMSEEDFEAYKAAGELRSSPLDAGTISRDLVELEK